MTIKYIGTFDEQVKWGSNNDPRGVLVEGQEYEVLRVEPHTWHTKVYLKDYPDLKFNSASFEPCLSGEETSCQP